MTDNTGDNARYNGYVNGPKLVSQALTKGGKPKQFKDWLKTKESKEYINELQNFEPAGISSPM